jgi:NAD(P)-dependent dehydrogenase (short-subunit alcohol dehydrogenase family)
MRLKGKVAIVTGASKGIGRQIALRVAEEGSRVCVCDIDSDGLMEIMKEIKARKGEAVLVKADISREEEVEQVFRETLLAFGTVDILVNNVGILGPVCPIHTIRSEDWRNVVETNLNGTFYFIKHALEIMIPKRSGNIINIGSVAAVLNQPNRSVYAVTKRAIVAITQSVAAEVGLYNIRCNCVSPGPMEGERFIHFLEKKAELEGKSFEEMKRSFMDQIPLRRLISTEDIARSVIFLASDDAGAITGQHLCVSGGQGV